MSTRRRLRILKIMGMVFAGIAFAFLFALVFGLVVQICWNYLMPELFGLKTITYFQAFVLVIFAKILFGAWGSYRGKHHYHRHSKMRYPEWDEDWASDVSHKKWKYYRDFWREEGKKAFDEYVKKVEVSNQTK